MPFTVHRSRFAVAGALGALLAAGCGGRSSEAPAGGSVAPSGAGTTASAAKPAVGAAHPHGANAGHEHAGADQPHGHGPGGEVILYPKLAPEEIQRRRGEAGYQVDLAQVHLKYGHADDAIRAIQKGIGILGEFGEENAVYFYVLAKAHQAKNDAAGYRKGLEDAIRVYGALHTQAKKADIRNFYCEKLSELYGELGDSPKSVEWADQLGSEGESDVVVSRSKARLYLANAQADKALKVLEEAEARATATAMKEQASYNIAEVLLRLNRTDDALARLKNLSEGAAEAPLRTQAKRLLIDVYDKRGELDKVKLGGEKLGASGGTTPPASGGTPRDGRSDGGSDGRGGNPPGGGAR